MFAGRFLSEVCAPPLSRRLPVRLFNCWIPSACACEPSSYSMSPSSMLKLDLRLESTEASGDIADSSGSPPMGDRASSIIRKPSSPLLAWTSSPPRSPSPDMPSEKAGIPSEKSSVGAKSKGWELPTDGYWRGG